MREPPDDLHVHVNCGASEPLGSGHVTVLYDDDDDSVVLSLVSYHDGSKLVEARVSPGEFVRLAERMYDWALDTMNYWWES